jgi:hypothetical protein
VAQGASTEELSYPFSVAHRLRFGGTETDAVADPASQSGWNDPDLVRGPSPFEAVPSMYTTAEWLPYLMKWARLTENVKSTAVLQEELMSLFAAGKARGAVVETAAEQEGGWWEQEIGWEILAEGDEAEELRDDVVELEEALARFDARMAALEEEQGAGWAVVGDSSSAHTSNLYPQQPLPV